MNLLISAQNILEKHMQRGKVAKAAFTTTDLNTGGGLLAPQQAKRLIQLVRFGPELLKYVRFVSARGPTERLDRITFADRILHAATEGTALATSLQAKPTTSKVEFVTQEFKAEVQLTYNALQDSIEGGQNVRGNRLENTIYRMMGEKIGEDCEEIGLLSDSADASLHNDLQQFDGWLKLARDQNTYNHGGAVVNKGLFKQLHLQLPKQYRKRKRQLRFVVSPNCDIEWADEQADRVTTTGDMVPWGDRHPDRAYGIPNIVSGYMPEESGGSSNSGQILHTHPKNMVFVIWRQIFLEVDRDIRQSMLIVVATVRIVTGYEQVEGTAVATNVTVA